jgi:hypothetical protein
MRNTLECILYFDLFFGFFGFVWSLIVISTNRGTFDPSHRNNSGANYAHSPNGNIFLPYLNIRTKVGLLTEETGK